MFLKSVRSLPLALFLLFCPSPSFSEIIKEFGLKTTLTDNLNASVKQMQEPLDTVSESTFLGRLGLGYKGQYGKRNLFYGIYRFDMALHKDSERLRFRNHSIFLQANNNLSKLTTVNASAMVRHYDYYNLDVLTNTEMQLDLFLKHYLKMSTVLEANYNFSSTQFENVNFKSPIDMINMTYSLVDRHTHAGRLKLKRWMTKWFRTSIGGAVGFSKYDHTASMFLFDLTGIKSDENRLDIYWNVRPAMTFVSTTTWLFSFGYLFENNRSSSSYYDFNANGIVFDVFYSPYLQHKVFLLGKYGFYDFFDRQIDTRVTDTKIDNRLYVTLGYTYEISDHISLLTRYDFKINESNDSEEYELKFTKSRSFGSFKKNDLSSEIRFTF